MGLGRRRPRPRSTARPHLGTPPTPPVPPVLQVVLVGEGGALLEGLSSNFFVVQGGALRTAGEGVLLGSVRELVLRVARREGVPVLLSPPLLGELDAWEGALISSTSRLLLPVDEVEVAEAALPRRRAFARGGLAARLEELVLAEVAANCEPLL